MIVVDANILAYFLLPGPRNERAEALQRRDPEWATPFLCLSELRNIVLGFLRRRQLSGAEALEVVTRAEEILSGREYTVSSERVLALAATSGCTAYDCEYAALAEDLRVPLVTSDRQILRAFPRTAISLEEAVAQLGR